MYGLLVDATSYKVKKNLSLQIINGCLTDVLIPDVTRKNNSVLHKENYQKDISSDSETE